MADPYPYNDEFYALDAEVYTACLALAPQLNGVGVELSDLDDLCRTLQRPVRDDSERAELMLRLDPENAMRIDRTAVTAWLLEELYAVQRETAASSTTAQRPDAVPSWEEIVESPVGDGTDPPSVYYYNASTGETAWAIARPFAAALYKHVVEMAEIRTLKAAHDIDGLQELSGNNEMVDDLQLVFTKCDDDRNGVLDANEFRDLCVAIAFPLGVPSENSSVLIETMQEIDVGVDGSRFSGVAWDALLEYWITYSPWQRRTRLAPPYDQWERLERLDRRAQSPWFRHTTTLRERWQPPSADQSIVDLLTKLFPSTKLEWRQRIDMLWELQLRKRGTDTREVSNVWTLHECRALFEQLGWDHCTRREYIVSAVQNLQTRYGDHSSFGTEIQKETIVAWMLDCVQRVSMDGWDECVDATTGKPYFHHEVRGLTQWDPPNLEDSMATMMARFTSPHGSSTDDQIQRIFRHYDDDESGSISFDEFKRLYIALLGRKEAVASDSPADDAQIQQVFSVLDTSGDDAVSVDEFTIWWKTKLQIENDETEQQRLVRMVAERKRIAIEFLQHHDALRTKATTTDETVEADETGAYAFESNMLARLVSVLGKYPLKGIAYRDALGELVHATRVVEQEILLDDFLEWYIKFDEQEREKEELAAQKARALALLHAQEVEATEKARKLKMIRKGQLLTKAIASDAAAVGGTPAPAELIWKRHVQTLFRKCDKDNSGFLDATELQELTSLLGHALDNAQIQHMMLVMDSSGDARISVDEFVTFWTAFQRRQRVAPGPGPGPSSPASKKTKPVVVEAPQRREAISMVDATATLAVGFELAKERALKLTVGDMKDALGDWKESLLDRNRKKHDAKTLAAQDRQRLEALRKEWAAFVPTKKRRYAHVDVTWIEPEVVGCMVDLIETVRRRARPLPRPDAALRIQRILRGGITRMRLFATTLDRFHTYVDIDTKFFYYVDTATDGRVWLHRPLFRTITSSVPPYDLVDCKTKVETLRFRRCQRQMLAKQTFYDLCKGTLDGEETTAVIQWKRPERAHFVPAVFVVYSMIENVRLRLLGNLWHALRDQSFSLAELMVRHHWRQLTVRSSSDASAPFPLHYVVTHHRTIPFRLLHAIYHGHPDAVRERDAYGRTPLHLAFRERAGFQVLTLLLSRRQCLIDEPTRAVPQRTSVWAMQSVSGESPLHVALRYGVSLELFRWLCCHRSLYDHAAAAAMTIRNRRGFAIFHLVISTLFTEDKAAYWRSVVRVLLRTWPRQELCSEPTGSGDLPLHLAIERYADVLNQRGMHHTAVSTEADTDSWLWLIRLLIAEFPDALLVRRTHDALLPIHLLMRVPRIPEALVLEALDATVSPWNGLDPQDLLTKLMLTATNTTLLHYALLRRSDSDSLLLTLFDLLPLGCRVAMQPQNELPLHLAARQGASTAVVTRLCELYGAACQARNAKNELPLHLAVQSPGASEGMVRVLLHYCPFVLSEPSERHGLRSLVLAANVATPNAGVLRAVLDHTPPQQLSANAHTRAVTPLFAISLRKCDAAITQSGIFKEFETKFEDIEDADAYFLVMAKAKHRRQHHCPTADWSIPRILDLLERNPVNEAIIQRSLLALQNKLTQMQRQATGSSSGNQDSDKLGVVVETVTLNREYLLVRRIHQTMYELPWNARVQLLGQTLLTQLLPTAFAKAAYKARIDPYFNL